MSLRISLRLTAALVMASLCFAQGPLKASKKAPPKSSETFVQWLARVTGLSATSSSFKGGPADATFGDISVGWTARGGSQRLTFEGGWSWPVFGVDDKEILAIRESALWSIPVAGGDPVKLPHSPAGIKGLLGAGKDGLVVFTDSQIGLFEPNNGSFTAFESVSSEDQGDMARSRSPRVLDLKADGQRAMEPSVSHSGDRVVYIR